MTKTENRDRTKRYCCHRENGKPCFNEPIWEVWVMGGDPYIYWDACHEHVADMLTDAQIHEIHRIEVADETKLYKVVPYDEAELVEYVGVHRCQWAERGEKPLVSFVQVVDEKKILQAELDKVRGVERNLRESAEILQGIAAHNAGEREDWKAHAGKLQVGLDALKAQRCETCRFDDRNYWRCCMLVGRPAELRANFSCSEWETKDD